MLNDGLQRLVLGEHTILGELGYGNSLPPIVIDSWLLRHEEWLTFPDINLPVVQPDIVVARFSRAVLRETVTDSGLRVAGASATFQVTPTRWSSLLRRTKWHTPHKAWNELALEQLADGSRGNVKGIPDPQQAICGVYVVLDMELVVEHHDATQGPIFLNRTVRLEFVQSASSSNQWTMNVCLYTASIVNDDNSNDIAAEILIDRSARSWWGETASKYRPSEDDDDCLLIFNPSVIIVRVPSGPPWRGNAELAAANRPRFEHLKGLAERLVAALAMLSD